MSAKLRSVDTRDVQHRAGIVSVTKQVAQGNDATTLDGIGRCMAGSSPSTRKRYSKICVHVHLAVGALTTRGDSSGAGSSKCVLRWSSNSSSPNH